MTQISYDASNSRKNVKLLESVQRQAVRYICGVYDRRTSITPLVEQLKLNELALRRIMNQCTMFFKIHNNLINVNFPSCVSLLPTSGRSHNLRYNPVQASRDTFQKSFFVRTIPIWNKLPLEAVTASTAEAFQTAALPAVRKLYSAADANNQQL